MEYQSHNFTKNVGGSNKTWEYKVGKFAVMVNADWRTALWVWMLKKEVLQGGLHRLENMAIYGEYKNLKDKGIFWFPLADCILAYVHYFARSCHLSTCVL